MIFGAILAGGIGERIGLEDPKQFYRINNKPLLIYSIESFLKVDDFDLIFVSSPKDYIDKTKEIIDEFILEGKEKLKVISGGKTRNDTILNSIAASGKTDDSIMVTHDAARIFVTPEQIQMSIDYCKEYTVSSPVIPSVDVVFESKQNGELTSIPPRKNLVRAQTPQAFKINKFIEIYEDLDESEIKLLDEAMALFYLRNESIYLFEGDTSNFKVTVPLDIDIAKTILEK